MVKALLLIFLPVVLLACAKPDPNNLEDKAKREIEIENENTRKKAQIIETDLERRQRFFASLEGTYVGTFQANNKQFETQMTFVPSLPPYQAGRTRTIEELTADLNNLFFTIQVKHTNSEDGYTVGGCIISQVRPNYDAGQALAANENCSSVYMISLYNSEGSLGDLLSEMPNVPKKSHELAQKILSKQLTQIEEIFVTMKPTLVGNSFLMVLRKMEKK